MNERGKWNEGNLERSCRKSATVKSIVTLVLTLVFSVLAVTSRIDGGQFLNIFSIVIAFYFGTQHRKSMTQEVAQEKGDAE